MSQIIKRLVIFVCCFMMHAVWAGSVDKQPLDLRILVDISSSVRNSLPDNQHLDALALLVEQLPENSRAGIWTYGKYVNYLVKQGPVSELWRKNAVSQIQRIRSVAINRNLEAVLKKAAYDLNNPNTGYRKVLLLVSSGGTLVSELQNDNRTADEKLRNDLLPKLRAAGYRIHTIAINPNADNRLLQTLAKETGGFSFVLESSEDIYHIFQMIKQWIIPANYLPISEQLFAVDTEVEEFSALLLHRKQQPVTLIAPNGDRLTETTPPQGGRWFQGERFALVGVKQPLLGQWTIEGEAGKYSRVYLQSEIGLTLNQLKDHYYVGQNIELEAQLEGVDRDGFQDNESVRMTAELHGRDNFTETLSRSNLQPGLYSAQINGFTEPGLYHLKVLAETVSYSRISDQIFQVDELLEMEVALQTRGDLREYQLTISPKDEDLNLQQSTVIATVTDSQGEWKVRTISLNQDGYWELIVEDDGKSTEFTVDLDFKGQSRSGREITFKPKPLVIEIDRIAQAVAAEPEIPNEAPRQEEALEGAALDSPAGLETGEAQTERSSSSISIFIWFLAGTSVLFAGAVVFYWVRWRRSESTSKEAPKLTDIVPTPEIEQPDDEAKDSVEAAEHEKSVIQETEHKAEDYSDEGTERHVEIEVDGRQDRAEAVSEPDQIAEVAESVTEPDFEHDSDEIEVEIDLDEVLQEETELASEWRNMDVASDDVSQPDDPEKAFEEIEIQIELDEENLKQEKKPETD